MPIAQAHEIDLPSNFPRDFLVIQNSSRDFFAAGYEKLETEIKLLDQGQLFDSDILEIDDDVHLKQEQNFRLPDFLNESEK